MGIILKVLFYIYLPKKKSQLVSTINLEDGSDIFSIGTSGLTPTFMCVFFPMHFNVKEKVTESIDCL